MDRSEQQNEKDTQTVKRPYSKPQVSMFGDLREITNAVGKNGALDGTAQKLTIT